MPFEGPHPTMNILSLVNNSVPLTCTHLKHDMYRESTSPAPSRLGTSDVKSMHLESSGKIPFAKLHTYLHPVAEETFKAVPKLKLPHLYTQPKANIMADLNHLFGSCACERNQYTVIIPGSSASLAQVYFDNSAANRRSQATPVTAWLRVPLEWYHSTTFAQYPDEIHSSIKRTFNTPPTNPALPPTRRQFCGYCGTHLTAWNEGLHGAERGGDTVDVTLGSLLNESLNRLESLQLYGDLDEESESESGLVKDRNATISAEDHIATNEESIGGVDGPPAASSTTVASRQRPVIAHRMQNRGMPYFEEMVENSRLGRIKRQKGGHTSADGARSVQWEVIEIGGDDDDQPMGGTGGASASTVGGNKRIKIYG